MEFKHQTPVVTTDNREVGQIERVVIDPNTAEVTHLVIQIGLLKAKHKVVPIDSVLSGDENQIVLRMAAEEVQQQPDFEEIEYLATDETKLGRETAEGVAHEPLAFAWYPLYPPSPLVPYRRELPYATGTHLNIPDGTMAVKEGAKVITRDGKQTGRIDDYSGPIKLDTETGRLKVYNYGHAQTIFRGLQGPSRHRTPQRGEDRQSTRHRTWRASDPITRLEEASPGRPAESV